MIVFRVGKTKYAEDLTGEGASLFGGRWNNKRIGCIYTSESRALALLEYTANVNIDEIPRALSITAIRIIEADIVSILQKNLPGNWQQSPAPSSTKDFGSDLLKNAENTVIKIPSVIISQEYNYLLNPQNYKSNKFKILEVSDFIYDVRLKG